MCNISLKPTHIGSEINVDTYNENLQKIITISNDTNNFVRIDMESSKHTDFTINSFLEQRKNNLQIGTVFQAYLYRTYDDVAALDPENLNFRLCKGIYKESDDVCINDRMKINENYLKILRYAFEKNIYVGIATHDTDLLESVYDLIDELHIPSDRFEFQVLYGVPMHGWNQKNLENGYKVRVYVPFGEDWYKYSIRRLKENPNIAKEMHVGHLRSTIIGDCLARILEFQGHEVVRQNHMGDWGTQFGMLLLGWKTQLDKAALNADPIAELERIYKLVNGEEALRDDARAELVNLQNGDEENLGIWRRMIELSQVQFDHVYSRLAIEFDETLGESFYNSKLAGVVEDLISQNIAEESEGAMAVFFPDNAQLADKPAIVRKSDGAANYTTTDLATLQYRLAEWEPDEIVYVTDGRQQDHFEQLFLTVEKWYVAEGKSLPNLRHVWFGTILGEDNKAIKTREGQPIKLLDLLGEAVSRARAIVDEKNPELEDAEKQRRAQAIGLGAVRYADLSQDRTLDYVFSWDKLLALQGNTAPYLQYAVARIRSIFRKLDLEPGQGEEEATPAATETENLLARRLLYFPSVLEQTRRELKPHHLCGYLYELATDFSSFYNADKVMVEETDVRARRILLCARTLLILETGLGLLGIETLDRM